MSEMREDQRLCVLSSYIEGEVSQYWITTEDGMSMLCSDIWNHQGRSLQSSLSNLEGRRVRVTIQPLD